MRRPCGIYSTTYSKDNAIFRTKNHWGLLIGFLILMMGLPLVFEPYVLNMFITFFVQLIAVLGLMILTGYCGQISLGQAAFACVGAFTSAVLVSKLGMPALVSFPCAILSSVIFGLCFGLPALRIKGFYLAMSTLAAQFIIIWLVNHLPEITGGSDGMRVAKIQLAGMIIDSSAKYYYFSFGLAVVFTYIAKNLIRSKIGRAWIAIRDNDIAAEVMGVNLTNYKLLAFAICSAFAGVSGALWSHFVPAISWEHFTLWESIWYLAMIVIGGIGTITGAIFGTAFIRLLDELVTLLFPLITPIIPSINESIVAGALLIIYGLAIAIFLIFEPRGLAHRWEMFKSWYRLWPFRY
jgi:branched-chain amino acid transport system permease protein